MVFRLEFSFVMQCCGFPVAELKDGGVMDRAEAVLVGLDRSSGRSGADLSRKANHDAH